VKNLLILTFCFIVWFQNGVKQTIYRETMMMVEEQKWFAFFDGPAGHGPFLSRLVFKNNLILISTDKVLFVERTDCSK
jgi:hypothetical protein